ncbi:anti-sigma factor domain-containing protein [Nocardia sp. NPDC057668]|uniref:anti-sigma factor n=1 Tax=Nocardia sp. NPDC057668 TaxID=3346202 RepID=UPI003672973D
MPDDDHADLLDYAYPYALDALTDAERDDLEHALTRADSAVADSFRTTVRDIREAMATMSVLDAHPAPPSVEAALNRALDAEQGIATPVPLRPRRAFSPRLLAAAAAVAAVIAIGVTVAVLRSQSGEPGQITAQQIQTHSDTRTATTAVTGGGTFTVAASGELDAATISFATVPPPPADHAYQLWLIPSSGLPESAAVMTALPTDTAPMVLLMSDRNPKQLAITIEPAGGSAQPTTDVIAAMSME